MLNNIIGERIKSCRKKMGFTKVLFKHMGNSTYHTMGMSMASDEFGPAILKALDAALNSTRWAIKNYATHIIVNKGDHEKYKALQAFAANFNIAEFYSLAGL